jgi:hypothetical protein
MSLRAELARIEGDYVRSKEYTETMASQIGAPHLHSRAVTLLRPEGLEPS